jgi:phthalate 4,5-cis-dihydrodiol dehydrogenase
MTTHPGTLNVGIVGLGMAGAGNAPAIAAMPNARLVGAADVNPRSLASFREKYQAKTYGSIEEICRDPEIDTVWIATPNVFHCPHTVMAAESGKNVIVEKPMAISLAEAEQMIDACDKNGVQLVCGGSRSSSAVVRKMREIVRGGELGRLRAMTSWAATDWMLRPRRPDEYDVQYGGGVAFRQSPHMVDSCRLLAGGLVRSVRGMTGQWMPPRDTAPGYFSALLEFDDGIFATIVYSAYGYFMASELFQPETGGPRAPGLEGRVQARHQIVSGARDETAAKEERIVSSQRPGSAEGNQLRGSGYLSDLGLLVVSCEHGDMRQSPEGIYIYADDGTTELPLTETRRAHSAEIDELYDALVDGKPLLHGGRWGLATLEVSIAIMQSAKEHRDISMQHQVPVPDWA